MDPSKISVKEILKLIKTVLIFFIKLYIMQYLFKSCVFSDLVGIFNSDVVLSRWQNFGKLEKK